MNSLWSRESFNRVSPIAISLWAHTNVTKIPFTSLRCNFRCQMSGCHTSRRISVLVNGMPVCPDNQQSLRKCYFVTGPALAQWNIILTWECHCWSINLRVSPQHFEVAHMFIVIDIFRQIHILIWQKAGVGRGLLIMWGWWVGFTV